MGEFMKYRERRSVRELVRQYAPPGVRRAVQSFRHSVKGPPIYRTELGAYRFAPDDDPALRLTLVLPSVARRSAFGGITTGIAAFRGIGACLRASVPCDLRIITTMPEGLPADSLVPKDAGIAVQPGCVRLSEVSVREREVFFAYNWMSCLNLVPLIDEQRKHFGTERRPLFYIVQDYEPAFYGFSADNLLARESLEVDWPLRPIVNSSLLADYMTLQGHSFEKQYVFEPKLTETLRPFVDVARTTQKERKILVYGRPTIGRNCFPLIEDALKIWVRQYPDHHKWTVLSVGERHPPVPLGANRHLRSLGKLDLKGYAELLCSSAIGVSLMASPHPSYPPLEMAHFGVRVLTNRYANKDLSTAHENIVSVRNPQPVILAEQLERLCRDFEANPKAGAQAASFMPGYITDSAFPLAAEIASDIRAALQ